MHALDKKITISEMKNSFNRFLFRLNTTMGEIISELEERSTGMIQTFKTVGKKREEEKSNNQ